MRGASIALRLVLLLAIIALLSCDSKPRRDMRVGADFTLRDLQGNTYSLSSYKGKVVLLDFWATWCGPCTQSVPELNVLYERYKDRGFVVLAISLDENMFTLRDFIKEYDIKYPVLVNDGTDKQYGVYKIPTMFILDRAGTVRKKHMGYAVGIGESLAKEIEELL